jgi:hypothetical protein
MQQQILNTFINPDTAAQALEDLVRGHNLYQTFWEIGAALIVLFTLLEMYRLWTGRGTYHDLLMLGVKIILLTYLLTPSGGPAPLEDIVMGAYGYFARLGQYIAGVVAAQQGTDLWTTLNRLSSAIQVTSGNLWDWLFSFGDVLLTALMLFAIWGMFLVVFMLVLGLYIFTVLASRVFLIGSIILAPLILPLALWHPMGSFLSRWVSTTVHAFFLPVIGAVMLVVALKLGMLAPLKPWLDCVQATTGPAYQCVGQQLSSFVSAIMGGLVALFIMVSVDNTVSSFIGAAEVTAAGVLAARWLGGGARRLVGGRGRAAPAPRPQGPQTVRVTERNLDTGETRRLERTTEPVRTPQAPPP